MAVKWRRMVEDGRGREEGVESSREKLCAGRGGDVEFVDAR